MEVEVVRKGNIVKRTRIRTSSPFDEVQHVDGKLRNHVKRTKSKILILIYYKTYEII